MEYLLGFGSTHRVLKAEEALKGAVVFRLLPAPKQLAALCDLVISLDGSDLEAALDRLGNAHLKPKNIFRKEGEGYVKV